jgi:hypothetical protein
MSRSMLKFAERTLRGFHVRLPSAAAQARRLGNNSSIAGPSPIPVPAGKVKVYDPFAENLMVTSLL